jgi:hypothetical protein
VDVEVVHLGQLIDSRTTTCSTLLRLGLQIGKSFLGRKLLFVVLGAVVGKFLHPVDHSLNHIQGFAGKFREVCDFTPEKDHWLEAFDSELGSVLMNARESRSQSLCIL